MTGEAFSKRGQWGRRYLFDNSITGNFMVHQDRLETIYCIYSRTQKMSEWFSIIFVIIFEINIFC